MFFFYLSFEIRFREDIYIVLIRFIFVTETVKNK